jgi:NADPH:quinone reductase-like Zn-dependent oxidoreductase
MKAMVYHKYGCPDVVCMDDIEQPIPADDEVLVKVYAVSINAWDWDTLTGKPFEYRLLHGVLKPKSTKLHGCDIAGIIVDTGKNVTGFQVGDEVFGDVSAAGWGAFAEYYCAAENQLIHKPAAMTFADAACLSHGGNLAVQGLIDVGKIQPGQQLLINGAGGSTGTLAIQIAKLFNVEVTAVDHTAKLDMMRAMGADHVIDYTKVDFTRAGKQYDVIFDVKTTRSVFDYQRVLKPNGNYVTVGGNTLRLLQIVLLGKLLNQVNMSVVSYTANKDSHYIVQLFEEEKLKPVIDRCFSLENTAQAFRYYGAGLSNGKVVVTLDSH